MCSIRLVRSGLVRSGLVHYSLIYRESNPQRAAMQPLGCTPLIDSQHRRGRIERDTDLDSGREGGPRLPYREAHTYLGHQPESG
jgi:hypothetical protein